jgi:hypothetical protein
VAWTPDGRLVTGQGARLLSWRPGETGWSEIADLSASGLSSITRLAVSPDNRWIAIVAEPAAGTAHQVPTGEPARPAR